MKANTIPEQILNHMRMHPNTVILRTQIAIIIYGEYWNKLSLNVVNNYINISIMMAKRYLKKGEEIKTVRGVGYELKSKSTTRG